MGSIDRVVNVIAAPDTIRPVITLSGVSVVNVEFISPFVDDGASWTDNVDGSGVIAAFTSGSINTGALGSYVVSYGYTDWARNAGTGVTRTVNVVDTTAPVVTLSGATPVSITVGGSFIDNGANWTDAHAGSGFIGAFNSGSVNVNNTGSYTVAYVYGDASGNTGSLSRVVNVIAAPARVVGGWGGGGSSSSYGSYNQAYLPISRNAPSNTTTLANNITRNLGIALLQRNLNNATSTFEADPKTDPAKTTPIVIFQERSFANSINIDDISESIAERIIKVLMTRWVLKNSNKFEPKRDITRAEFVKILTLVLGLEETFINVKMPFGDIGGDSEFRRYIMVALELGWINPNQKSFRPNDTITLSEVNKIISAAIGIGDANAGVKESENVSREEAILLINGSIVIN